MVKSKMAIFHLMNYSDKQIEDPQAILKHKKCLVLIRHAIINLYKISISRLTISTSINKSFGEIFGKLKVIYLLDSDRNDYMYISSKNDHYFTYVEKINSIRKNLKTDFQKKDLDSIIESIFLKRYQCYYLRIHLCK